MRYIPLLFLLLIPIQANAEEHTWKGSSLNYYWAGGSVGRDVIHRKGTGKHFHAITASFGSFPEGKKGFGYISYLEYAHPLVRGVEKNLWTIGFEPIWKYRFFYAGLGLSLSDDYTAATGTKWNFSIPIGVRFNLGKEKNMFIDANVRHRSHGSKLGIRESRENNGLNILSLQFGVNFRSY